MRRLSICYLVPGHVLLPSAGPTRNVLSLAGALAAHADVTVAFRRVAEPPAEPHTYGVIEVEPSRGAERPPDDAALRGIGYLEFLRYLRALRAFAAGPADGFDVVLEKSWLLSGYVSAACGRRGIPAIPVENLVPVTHSSGRSDPVARLRGRVSRWLAGRYLRRAARVIVETEQLRRQAAEHWGIEVDRIDVVPLGVDSDLFRPSDASEARRLLVLPEDATILLYAGVLDRLHDLDPVLRGLTGPEAGRLTLVVLGDGPMGDAYRRLAATLGVGERVLFKGRVPHTEVPGYLAAADLCLAPYDPGAFFGGEVGYATLKIREYLAAGRPVASVRSGTIPKLVADGRTGFLVEHTPAGWSALFERLPDRARLAAMGRAAAAEPVRGWAEVALDVLAVCEREVAAAVPGRAA